MPSTVVLVAEDDVATLDMIELALERHLNIRVAAARDGLQALRQAANLQPDLVVLDRDIPGMDGLQVVRLLKLQPRTRVIPVIGLAADDDAAGEAVRAGCTFTIAKPFDAETIAALIQAHLAQQTLPSAITFV